MFIELVDDGYTENFLAPATQMTTMSEIPHIIGLTVSFNNQADKPKPKNGCSSCNCPTASTPPCAKP